VIDDTLRIIYYISTNTFFISILGHPRTVQKYEK